MSHPSQYSLRLDLLASSMALLLLLLCSAVANEVDTLWARPHCGDESVRPQDQIWLIGTGQANSCWPCDDYRPPLKYFRLVGHRHWHRSNMEAFLAEDRSTALTLFWVHGNRVDPILARRRGLAVYRALVAASHDERPIRFVIFSWPSTKVRGQLFDIRLKARLSSPAGCQLAWVVDNIAPETPIGMIGYSFGARVITEALHVLGGGRVCDVRLRERKHPERRSVRVVLAAAALGDDWLLPGYKHGKALSQVERMLLLNNHCDWVIRWYQLVERRDRSQALGRNGMASIEALGDDACKIEQFDVYDHLGRSHDVSLYINCPHLMSNAWSTLSGEGKLSGEGETSGDVAPRR